MFYSYTACKCLPALNTRMWYEIARTSLKNKKKKSNKQTKIVKLNVSWHRALNVLSRSRYDGGVLRCLNIIGTYMRGLEASSINFIKQLDNINLIVCMIFGARASFFFTALKGIRNVIVYPVASAIKVWAACAW